MLVNPGNVSPPAARMTQVRCRARQTAQEESGVGGWEDSLGEFFFASSTALEPHRHR